MANLYNHVTLGTKDKPLIRNIQFKQLIARIERGDLSAYEKAFEHFIFESFQKQFLTRIYTQSKIKYNGSNDNNKHP